MPLFYPHGFRGLTPGVPTVRFNGSTWLTRGAMGVPDTPDFGFSVWVKFNGGDGTTQQIYMCRRGTLNGWDLWRASSNALRFQLRWSVVGTLIADYTFGSITVASGWTHILGVRFGGNAHRWYINGTAVVSDTASTNFFDSVGASWLLAINQDFDVPFNGDMADLRFWQGDVPNFLDSSIREQVIRNGRPVRPTPNGAVGGIQPIVYLTAKSRQFNVNLGSITTNGDFTVSSGTLSYLEDNGLNYID